MEQNQTQQADAARPAVSCKTWLGLFAGHHYYPRGGADDFRCFGDSVDELKRIYAENSAAWSRKEGSYPDPWGQIVDTRTMKVIWQAGRGDEWEQP